MGLKPDEVRRLTYAEFNIMYSAYLRREEKDWDIARRTWGYLMIYGGLGLKDSKAKITPQMILPLPYTDAKVRETKITTLEQALKLLNSF